MPKVIHFEFATVEPKKTVEFYSKAFGWQFRQFDADYWLVTAGEQGEDGIDGAIMTSNKGHAYTINTITVSSVDEYMEVVTANGGKVTSEKMEIPNVGYFAYCEDPTGLKFGIIEFVPKA